MVPSLEQRPSNPDPGSRPWSPFGRPKTNKKDARDKGKQLFYLEHLIKSVVQEREAKVVTGENIFRTQGSKRDPSHSGPLDTGAKK